MPLLLFPIGFKLMLRVMKPIGLFFFLAFLLPSNAPAEQCRESSILEPAPFMGNNDEIFRLDDGSIWKVQFEYEYLYEYYPQVVICPVRKAHHQRQDAKRLSSYTPTYPPSGWTAFARGDQNSGASCGGGSRSRVR